MKHLLCRSVMLAIVPLLMAGAPQEGVIIFKDGFHFTGKVVEKKDLLVDPFSGQSFPIPSVKGFLYVDDHVRRIHFSPAQVQDVLVKKQLDGSDTIKLTRVAPLYKGFEFLPTWGVQSIGNWNADWERLAKVKTRLGMLEMQQRLTFLNPDYARADALKHNWIMYYQTRELGPELVRNLLDDYYKSKKELKEQDRLFEIARFLLQAGWPEHAAKELDSLVLNFPAQKDAVLPFQGILKKVQAQIFAEATERMHKVGQHNEAEARLGRFFRDGLAEAAGEKHLLLMQDLKNKYAAAAEKLKDAQVFLKELPAFSPNRTFWSEAAETIAKELNFDTLSRLETFLDYGRQFARDVQQKRKPSQTADEILALGVTGWLLGNTAAEPDVKTARLLYGARTMVLEYQREIGVQTRAQMLASSSKEKEIPADLLARLIRLLPPPEPLDKIDSSPMKLDINLPDGVNGTYLVQLPPEYHPLRAYPVLVVLHSQREKPGDVLGRWSQLAAEHGFILVAPVVGSGAYGYSAREHALILDCLRDLRRRLQIDSDRVFLFGWEEGGTMAFDIGMSHPDQFAGVLSMCGAPAYFPLRYVSNAQYLPFYVVDGDRNGTNPKVHRSLFKDWIRWQYPAIYVEYKGRLSEWFDGEVPTMMDWMERKRRAQPTKELGRYNTGGGPGEEFYTMRACDNRFYWLETDTIMPQHLNDVSNWNRALLPAKLQANILTGNELAVKGGGEVKGANIWNQINIRCFGVKNVTVWLAPGMIDFSKPVLLRVNGQPLAGGQRLIPPNGQHMLEEFYQSGDRQRLYYAKIDLKF